MPAGGFQKSCLRNLSTEARKSQEDAEPARGHDDERHGRQPVRESHVERVFVPGDLRRASLFLPARDRDDVGGGAHMPPYQL